ncbi:hypothetical protein [Agreia sp. COWG]|uniref:hypothetical protein n=1 Tax=Agreia sp. COWG TaxID=2773266 RepID=UPI001927E3A6|nr:hypothetical protein [Agreia sp. COWG]CAD5996017.1 conserved protein of unknown function [Agreia sp. COWG]
MEWWNGFVDWLNSNNGRFVVSGIVLPAVAIIVAALLGAWIASNSIKRLLAKHDRELKVAAIAALVDAAEQASVWNSLTPQEQILSDRAVGQADIQVRLLPIKNSDVAANWAAHSLSVMRRNSATFGYHVEPAVIEFRDRLIEWQDKPGRTRKAFLNDLDRWKLEDDDAEKMLARQQDDWVAQQHHEQFMKPESEATTVITPAQPQPRVQAPTPQNSTPRLAPAGEAAPDAASPTSNTPTAEPSAPTQNDAPREGDTESAEQRAARVETQRVLANINAIERRREAEGASDDATPPPVNAFPPRNA